MPIINNKKIRKRKKYLTRFQKIQVSTFKGSIFTPYGCPWQLKLTPFQCPKNQIKIHYNVLHKWISLQFKDPNSCLLKAGCHNFQYFDHKSSWSFLGLKISLHLGIPDNQILLHFSVPDNRIVLRFGVPDNKILLHFGVPDNCLMNISSQPCLGH